jgi:hypothetical protein
MVSECHGAKCVAGMAGSGDVPDVDSLHCAGVEATHERQQFWALIDKKSGGVFPHPGSGIGAIDQRLSHVWSQLLFVGGLA